MNARQILAYERDIVLDAPYAKLHISGRDVPDHALMRARQLQKLLLLIQPEEGPDDMLWLAQQMADEVAEAVAGMVVGSAA